MATFAFPLYISMCFINGGAVGKPELLNAMVNEYRLTEFLGEGGMGQVYRGEHIKIGRIAAVKVLLYAAESPKFIERFYNEARIQATLQHKNIAALYDFLEYGGVPCIIMEYVDGLSLDQRIRAQGTIPPSEALSIFHAVADAIAYLHQMGVIHRDIKPENIKINSDNEVKLLDFGIAKSGNSPKLTMTGNVIGTTHYLSPERIRGKPANERSDIWALGVLLYEMVTGRVPFDVPDAQSPVQLYEKIITGTYLQPTALLPELPPVIDEIVAGCLAKKPNQRYQWAAEIAKTRFEWLLIGLSTVIATFLIFGALGTDVRPPSDTGPEKLSANGPGNPAIFSPVVQGDSAAARGKVTKPQAVPPTKLPIRKVPAPPRRPIPRAEKSTIPKNPNVKNLVRIRIDATGGKPAVYVNGKRVSKATPVSFYAQPGKRLRIQLRQKGYYDHNDLIKVEDIGHELTYTMVKKRR